MKHLKNIYEYYIRLINQIKEYKYNELQYLQLFKITLRNCFYLSE